MKYLYIILLCLSAPAYAQEKAISEAFKNVSEQIYEKRKDLKPGSHIIGIQNNDIIYKNGNGLANIEHRVPITDSTIFDLASLAKMFTGYAIATLEEQKLLSTSDDIRKYLPSFPDYGHTITIGHLVHHTSGIKNWTSLLQRIGWKFTDKISFDQLIRLIYAQTELDFTPGDQYKYSNSGYNLLVKIIENVTEEDFVNWSQDNIFSTLKMENTFFNASHNRIIPNLAQGYYFNNHREQVRDYNNLTGLGSSSLYSNGIDISKWMNFLLNPPKEKQSIVNRMLSTKTLNNGEINNYAYGIDVDTYRGTSFIGHSGSWASNTSYLVLLPEYNAGIFVIHNFRTYTRRVVNKYIDLFLPKLEEEIKERRDEKVYEEVELTDDQLDAYLGTFKLGTAWFLTISRKDNQLFAKANGEGAFPMVPLNDSTFLVRAYGNRTVTFNREGTTDVTALTYNSNRSPKQITVSNNGKGHFEKYEGYFYCKELELLFNLKVEKDALHAHNIRVGEIKLTETGNDEFFGDGLLTYIVFDRSENGGISGFYISNSKGERRWNFIRA